MAETIRGAVHDKYKSVRAFARAVGWDRTKACDIVNQKREPRVSDLHDMARALDMPVEKVLIFFKP